MANDTQQILEELKEIKQKLDHIEEHMIDVDAILDKDDLQSIKDAEIDLKEGRTVTLDHLKRELGL